MKKIWLLVAVLWSGVFLSGCTPKQETKPTPTPPIPTAVPTKPVSEMIKEGPYVSLLVSADVHWITLEVKNIRKDLTALEYVLTYFADFEGNRLERGVSNEGKPIDLSGQTEVSKKLLLGSASCTTGTCKYKYDENVNEGMLVLTFSGSGNKEKYQSAFRIQKGKEAKTGFSTGDGVFNLVSTVLPANNSYLTISSIGVPVPLPEGVIAKAGPYATFPNLNGKGQISFKTTESLGVIYTLRGKTWEKLDTKYESGKAVADFVDSSLFILSQ